MQTLTCLDPAPVVSGLSTAHESAPECDARLVVPEVEYMLETKLKRDREVNIDICGEIGNSDSNKIYPKGLKEGNSISPEGLKEGNSKVKRLGSSFWLSSNPQNPTNMVH